MDTVRRKFMLVTIGTKRAKGALSRYFSHQLNSKNNGPVSLFKTIFRN